ncbi:Myosin heavy chain-related, putative isoform 1 [Melia azedarach]|uniref:Myosin heavy chain-related, putative isoform 1 n=1 Tax=Melia azedarach TaxID=155640 RepID=A0ACC1XNY7_MELAZ|nr:Myosin heavy chain-related, putative isoform 1 [Melia azedarach]
MSNSSRSDSESVFDVEELLQIETRCRELRKEKNMLRESQSQSFELIKRLEIHVKSLSEARNEDKEHIQKLERELMNCSQEIDYLQDQLNARNEEVYCLREHVHNLELKLVDMENVHDKVGQLEEELKRSHSERLLLIEELQSKEEELQNSALCIEKLDESISSSALDSQCEIESLKLDIMTLEQTCVESKKLQKENFQEKAKMSSLIKELEVRIKDAQEIIESLDKENNELKEKLDTSEINGCVFCQKIEEWMVKENGKQLDVQSFVSELERNLSVSKEKSSCGKVFAALLPKLAVVVAPDADLNKKIESMSLQICEYELLVKHLKEELRMEKFKAKEESDDLAQEMAELRYQMTGLLEEERKRRACVEQASLQRIAELEAQIEKRWNDKCVALGRHLHEAVGSGCIRNYGFALIGNCDGGV